MSPSDPDPLNFSPSSEAERAALAAFVRTTPLAYGTWGRFKTLYKALESSPQTDPALFGALAARLDAAPLSSTGTTLPVELGVDERGLRSLIVADRRVYCLIGGGRSTRFAGFQFDPANFLRPTSLGITDTAGAESLCFCGPFVCVLGAEAARGLLSVFDPTDLRQPRWRGYLDLGGDCEAVSTYPYIYAAVHANSFSGLRIVDAIDPDRLQIAGELAIKDAQHVACQGSLVALSSGETRFRWGQLPSAGALHLIDAADPRRPRLLSATNSGSISAVALRGNLAFVGVDRTSASDSPGLRIMDISDPTRPQLLGFCATRYYSPQSITLHGDYAYLTLHGAPQIVDIRRPDAPVIVGQMLTYGASSIGLSEDMAYVGTMYQGLELYKTINPAKPARIGTPPSAATFGYMKRRVRRALRVFAKTNPDGYVQLASEVLTAAAADTAAGIDPARQWVIADILYGGSDRYEQARHGRGPLVPTAPAKRRVRTREERAPEAWDRHPNVVSSLLTDPALPWPVHEAMFKIFFSQRGTLPALPQELLAGWVASPSPLLIRFAVRAVAARLQSGAFMPPEAAATAYVKAGVKQRQSIAAALEQHPKDNDWNRSFAGQIWSLASQSIGNGRLPRRHASACALASRLFPAFVPEAAVRTMAAALLSAGQPALITLVLEAARRVTPPEALGWLEMLGAANEAGQDQAVTAMASGLRSQAFTLGEAQTLVLRHGSEFVRASGWRLLAASATASAVFQMLWTSLLDSTQETPALRTAMTSPAALDGLARAGLSPQTIAARLGDRPFLAALLSPSTFAAILPTVPVSVALSLIAAVTADRWDAFRPFLRDYLGANADLSAFWSAVSVALASDTEERLQQRLLDDMEIAGTLVLADDPGLLSIREPAFDAVLEQWCRAHDALFPADSTLLLEAATHVLPAVRAWALDRVRILGLKLPFALRLLESSLPASVEVGGAFFTSLPHGASDERGHALALCDSPFAAVRALGRSFVSDRWETIFQEKLLSALFENSHPDMQAFVAELLARSAVRPAGTAGFDADVLRTRHTARRAKEQVKSRQSVEQTADVATLLSLARSRTPRDAEWALGQLAKLAVSGEEIEGLTVSGVSGG